MQAPVVKERNLGHPGRGSRILNDGGHPEKLEAVFGQRSQGCTHQWPGVPCSLFTRRKISISLCNSPQNCDGTKFAFSLFLKLCIVAEDPETHNTSLTHIREWRIFHPEMIQYAAVQVFFFPNGIYSLIYFWLRWVFVAVHWLSSSCSEQG